MKTWLLPILSLLTLNAVFSQTERLSPETLWEMGRVSLYDVSPDGKLVLYGVTYYDLATNKGSRDLFLVSSKAPNKQEIIQLTNSPESEGAASFSPDGERIYFLKNGTLWTLSTQNDEVVQVSEISMSGYKISPDGNKILFTATVKKDPTVADLYPDLPLADARIMDDLMYRHWDTWEDGTYSNIFVADLASTQFTSTPINIMDAPYDSPVNPFGGMEQINWAADGKAIFYTCKKERGKEYAQSTNTEIYRYDLSSRATTNVSAPNPGYDIDPVVSPDGRFLAWNSMETPGFEADRNRIMVQDLKTGDTYELSAEWDFSANHPVFSPDSKKIYFSAGVRATYHLFEVDLEPGSKPLQLSKGTWDYNDFIPTKDALIARRCSMSQPHEIVRLDLGSQEVSPLTSVNEEILSRLTLGKVEKRIVPTTDGQEMLVWMIYPPDFDPEKKYPALLYCQGGPQSAVSQFWSYRWNFQMMAANDYIIVAPNRRGLPSFGRAWNDQISGDWGGQAMEDLLAAIDHAKKESYIDEERLGAVGASYGGYSVYWLAGNHEGRFKSLIAHCGLFNLESWYGTTEELFFANQDLGGSYWQKEVPETYLQDSPHRYVQNWDTPILVIHGEKDFRVPVSEGMQAFQAAQLQGIPSRFLYFPNENHWVLSPQNGILWQRVFFDWLDRSLKTP